jgi:hypothetical protein
MNHTHGENRNHAMNNHYSPVTEPPLFIDVIPKNRNPDRLEEELTNRNTKLPAQANQRRPRRC